MIPDRRASREKRENRRRVHERVHNKLLRSLNTLLALLEDAVMVILGSVEHPHRV
jgi:hypothetical protein